MISDFIPFGKENAITRQTLCSVTGMSDRAVRRMIAQERARGVPIISCSHSAGYYMPESEEEKRIILHELGSRIANMARTYRAIQKTVQAEGQMSFEALVVNVLDSSINYLEEKAT